MKCSVCSAVCALSLSFAAVWSSRTQDTIYFLCADQNNTFQLARFGADGSVDTVINTGLSTPTFLSWPRDGSELALRLVNPQRPSKINQDVFAYFAANGSVQLVVPFQDTTSVEPIIHSSRHSQNGVQAGQRNIPPEGGVICWRNSSPNI